MPRHRRIHIDGVPQHIIQRGNNREPCFLTDQDRIIYLRILHEEAASHQCALHAFVLMSNHVHMLVTGYSATSVPRMMQNLGRRYVRHFNNEYTRTGTLWEGRYRSCQVADPRYVLVCYRYIELNPVRAALCKHPGDYRWTTFHANACGRKVSWLTPHSLYEELGNSKSARCQAYEELFADGLEEDMVATLRSRTNQRLAIESDDPRSIPAPSLTGSELLL